MTRSVKMDLMQTPSLRVYGGVAGEDRQAERRAALIEAGLELLGTGVGEPNLTVRGVCKQTGLAARYFYESFADRDALVIAVFDQVVTEIASTTLAAVNAAAADARAKTEAGLRNIVRRIAEDPRRGRLLFSPSLNATVLVHRRIESTRVFAALLGLQAQEFYGIAGSAHLQLMSDFLVGGLAQTLTSWLDGILDVSEDHIVQHCTEIFVKLADLL
jgi:AcrR family transcriptional regulator